MNKEFLTEVAVDRAAELGQSRDQVKFNVGVLKLRLNQLIAKQDQLQMNASEELNMPKGPVEEAKRDFLTLQTEISQMNESTLLKQAEFESLEKRLASVEALFLDTHAERN